MPSSPLPPCSRSCRSSLAIHFCRPLRSERWNGFESCTWQRAYNDVRSDYQLTIDREAGQVGVAFTIDEGRASVVADVVIEGNDKTSERLVREQLELTPSQPLDLSALSRSRKNLYDTGAFSIVDITRENLEGDLPAQSTTTSGPDQATGSADEKPVQVKVSVTEVQPYRLRYGASYDTERGPGGLFEISNHNSLGKARVVGLSARLDSAAARGTRVLEPAIVTVLAD